VNRPERLARAAPISVRLFFCFHVGQALRLTRFRRLPRAAEVALELGARGFHTSGFTALHCRNWQIATPSSSGKFFPALAGSIRSSQKSDQKNPSCK
jgi:hypothetical protein